MDWLAFIYALLRILEVGSLVAVLVIVAIFVAFFASIELRATVKGDHS